MFTIFVRMGEIKTWLDVADTAMQARSLARRWSRMTPFEVVVIANGEVAARCCFHAGNEVFGRPEPPSAAASQQPAAAGDA